MEKAGMRIWTLKVRGLPRLILKKGLQRFSGEVEKGKRRVKKRVPDSTLLNAEMNGKINTLISF